MHARDPRGLHGAFRPDDLADHRPGVGGEPLPARFGGDGPDRRDPGGGRSAVADPEDPVAPPVSAGGAVVEARRVTFTYPGRAEPALRGVSFSVARRRAGGDRRTHRLRQVHPALADPPALAGGGRQHPRRRRRRQPPAAGAAARRHRLRPPGDVSLLRHPRGEHRPGRGGRGASALPEVDAAGELAQFSGDVGGFPDGWRTLVGERGITLSGGQKQRAAIARALLRQPRLLILDDALSSVDTETEERILDGVLTAHPERTVLFVSHRLSTMRRADRILVLDEGRARRVRARTRS